MTDTARYIWLGITIGAGIAVVLPPYVVAVSIMLFIMANPGLGRARRHWKIDGVAMKWIAKGYGDAKSLDGAKAAVARGWRIWLREAGLGQ
jgi:hypothetical protein